MELPSKDKKGNSFLTPSEIATFKKDKGEYYNQYIIKKPFKGNAYTDFGNKVGNSLEFNVFDNFNNSEYEVLKKVKRLDLFERKTFLRYDDFYIPGRIDTCSSDFLEIIDYKTGGVGKEKEYEKKTYIQIPVYVLSLKQELGITAKKASVEFITRGGNAFKGESLYVKNTPVKSIEQDISINRLKYVYWDILKTAKEISQFYKLYK